MYTSRGNYPNSIIDGNQDSSYDGAIEPGGPYASTCTYGNAHSSGACWNFPADNWTTLLLHFVPGQDNSNYTGNAPNAATSTWPYHDTTIEVWKCDPGETTYTKIFEKFNLAWFYYTDSQTSAPNGPNGMFQPPAFNEVAPERLHERRSRDARLDSRLHAVHLFPAIHSLSAGMVSTLSPDEVRQ